MVKEDMVRFHAVDRDRIEVIYNGIDIERFRPKNRDLFREETRKELGLKNDEILILMVTNNFRLKGLYPAIRLLPTLKQRVRAPFRLLVVGRDDARQYQKEAERLGVSDLATFLDYVPDVAPLYAAADILFHPTFYDSCALVIFEALASGLPVVTTRKNGASGVIVSKAMGQIVEDPRDSVAMADALCSYFPQEARAKAFAAAEKMLPELSAARNHRRIQEVYRRVTSG
jgi:UDP-glucose:(heptosyl)LPS alpha-1,3-glucosyltransferase